LKTVPVEHLSIIEDIRRLIDSAQKRVATTVNAELNLLYWQRLCCKKFSLLITFYNRAILYKIGTTPHQHIFKHCSAVVHHGGAGTTQTATLHGCPSIIIEHFGDQLFWAYELQRLGIGAKPLHHRNLTSKKVAKAIRSVLASQAMKQHTEEKGELMRSENGFERACRIIQSHFCAAGKLDAEFE
jgi:Erythromycin biosynthesis protein CIII-like, C-terminal domain